MKRLAALMAVAFVDMIGLMIVLPLLPLYAQRLHADPATIGFLAASFPVAQLASSPVWGRVSDRYGRRPAILVGLGASALAYLIFGFADALWLLFVSRFVQGLGGGTTGVAQAYVADTMPANERAKALGWLSAATSLGVIVGPALGSLATHAGETAPGLVGAHHTVVVDRFTGAVRRRPGPTRRDRGQQGDRRLRRRRRGRAPVPAVVSGLRHSWT